MAKKKHDRWPELCEFVAEDDGLPCRPAGAWTEDKLFRWNRYLEITTSAMVPNAKWSALVYVDLFGGPGVCKLRETKKRFPGSGLLAAYAPKPFSRILVCEQKASVAQVLQTRLTDLVGDRASVIVGDCNVEIQKIVDQIPQGALTLAFIDPEGLHIHFETLRILTKNRRVDLAILLPDGMDIVRNVEMYERQSESNLDRFLGSNSDWRALRKNLANQNPENTCQLFADIYKSQLSKELGYIAFSDDFTGPVRLRFIELFTHQNMNLERSSSKVFPKSIGVDSNSCFNKCSCPVATQRRCLSAFLLRTLPGPAYDADQSHSWPAA